VHIERDGAEGFFHPLFQDEGTGGAEKVARVMIHFREEHRLVERGGIFKGNELHGIALFSVHRFFGDGPPDGGNRFPYPGGECQPF